MFRDSSALRLLESKLDRSELERKNMTRNYEAQCHETQYQKSLYRTMRGVADDQQVKIKRLNAEKERLEDENDALHDAVANLRGQIADLEASAVTERARHEKVESILLDGYTSMQTKYLDTRDAAMQAIALGRTLLAQLKAKDEDVKTSDQGCSSCCTGH